VLVNVNAAHDFQIGSLSGKPGDATANGAQAVVNGADFVRHR
jgi:hypothetical protein